MSKLKFIGFRMGDLPLPEISEDEENYDDIIDYLQNGKVVNQYLGFSFCKICGKRLHEEEFSDGVFLWTGVYAHYIKEHNVKPDQELIDHIRNKR